MVGLSLIAAIATAAYLVIRLYHPKKQNQRMSARLVEIRDSLYVADYFT